MGEGTVEPRGSASPTYKRAGSVLQGDAGSPSPPRAGAGSPPLTHAPGAPGGRAGSPPPAHAPHDLAEVARELMQRGPRQVLGLAGAPGAGKSTLATLLVRALGQEAALVPMDGFHLAQTELVRLGRAQRKGAPDTFDAHGYAALLERLRTEVELTVYAPVFRRDLEEPVANAIAVGPEVRLVVTEGNYLLDLEEPWRRARRSMDEVWYVDVDPAVRHERLVSRHIAHGRSPEAARQWVDSVDELNARRISSTRARADRVVVPWN